MWIIRVEIFAFQTDSCWKPKAIIAESQLCQWKVSFMDGNRDPVTGLCHAYFAKPSARSSVTRSTNSHNRIVMCRRDSFDQQSQSNCVVSTWLIYLYLCHLVILRQPGSIESKFMYKQNYFKMWKNNYIQRRYITTRYDHYFVKTDLGSTKNSLTE